LVLALNKVCDILYVVDGLDTRIIEEITYIYYGKID